MKNKELAKLVVPNGTPEQRAAFIDLYQKNRWLNLGDTTKIITDNPWDDRDKLDLDNPHVFLLDLMRRPENFGWTCQVLFNKTLPPFQVAILRELWVRPYPMILGSRGMGKSFILALYAMLRCLFTQGSKVVIIGSAFRQSKIVFDYCQEMWENGPIFRELVGPGRQNGPHRDVDRCVIRVGDSVTTAIPLGQDGGKIRGLRASVIACDEFAKIKEETYETVVRGFGAVSLSPVEKYQAESRKLAIKELGLWTDAHDAIKEAAGTANQTIISSTAYYTWNHFYRYWQRYKKIIETKGDLEKVKDVFGGIIPDEFDWRDYSIIRIPASELPVGFMDAKSIAQARAMIHSTIFQMEYSAIFPNDSDGFFKRSLVESCVVGKSDSPIEHPSCGEVVFNAVLRGNKTRRYVIGVDPAAEADNFAVVVLELWADHRRIVHCWTTNRKRYNAQREKKIVEDNDFYDYAARRIRTIHGLFPCDLIAIDAGGGGSQIADILQNPDKVGDGGKRLLQIIDPDEPKDSDGEAGEHIVELIQFSRASWTSAANHDLRRDFETKSLLFPEFDPAVLALSYEDDKQSGRVKVNPADASEEKLYDTLEDAVMEIEELKDELASIVHDATDSGRERWDTPSIKSGGDKKGRLRKDRYSALLMANAAGRVPRKEVEVAYFDGGGFAGQTKKPERNGPMYTGPAWATNRAGDGGGAYGTVVRRR